MENEFEKIVCEYRRNILEIFKNIIEKASTIADEKKLDPIDKYIYIMSMVNDAKARWADALSIDTLNDPTDDDTNIEICEYIFPYYDAACDEIKKISEDISNSQSVDEADRKLEKFKSIIDNPVIQSDYYSFYSTEINHDKNHGK